MKIALVSSHLTVYGGGGIFLRDYANFFSKNGHEVTIIAQKIDINQYKFNDSVSLVEIGGPLPSKPLHWLKLNKIKREYLEILNNLDVDLILSHYFPSNYFCGSMNKQNSKKHVHYCFEPYRYFHDKRFYSNAPLFLRAVTFFLRLLYKKYDIKGVQDSTELICISKFALQRAKKAYGRDGILHYIGINVVEKETNNFDLRQKLKIEKDVPIIFSLGLSHHFKGAEELILVFKKILLAIPESILIIGGKIKKENKIKIKKLIKKLDIPRENIILFGFINEEFLDNFYTQSTLTLYTALDEAFGLIPLESMKNKTPVIAFEGGPSEIIVNGKNGYVIKNGDLNAFALKAIKLIQDKKLYLKFSEDAKEHVLNRFSYEKCVHKLESILLEILSRE